MAKKIVTLYIDDTSIRLLVTRGKRIRKWADLPLEPGLVKNAVDIKETEVAAKIKQLFKVQKVKAKKVNVGVSGLHCLSRPITLPQLPKAMLAEAVKREAKRVLPVPLEQVYLSWQTIPAPEGKIQVFLVAVPCKMADTLLKVLHQAGLKPDLMDLKPLLLARMVKEATAVIVDVQPTEFDIVIVAGGVPQPIHTVSFPSEALSWQEKLPMIRDELDRSIKFYNSNNPEKPLVSTVPIFASIALAHQPELCQYLSDKLGHPVLPLSSPLACPEGLDPNRYMANIGLALKKLSPEKESGLSVANLNVLPTGYRPKPLSLTKVFTLPSTTIAIGLLVFLIILIQNTSADIDSIRVQLNTTDQLLQQRQELAENIAGLKKEITEVEASRNSFTAALGSLEKQSAGINRHLEVTIKSLPNSISLSSISHANSILTMTGRAPSEKEVLLYLRKLDSSGRFGEITITNMSRGNDEGMDFTLLGSLDKQGTGVSGIEVALNSLPTTISLTNVSSTNGTLNINGRSPDEDEILSYLQDLEASGKFSEITITSMSRIEDEGMDFSLVLEVRG